ncbi:MAG: 3-dehydroquinate synthase [Paludibacteraceae bacterium]|nr:3-dehydroquinate synthase [Bacteroidales bacterium]MDY4149749.1 3-dehydroquinate synthase [Paludibacteraceae bacterium]
MCFTFDVQSALAPILAHYPATQICVLSGVPVSVLSDGSCPSALHRPYPTLNVPQGEANKSLATIEQIWDFLLDHQITRQGLLINLGGGLTTDMGGFAASTYKRGIDFINIPTTLLAMVDASTGGKTGFNYHTLKNCIGTFADPIETIICPAFLRTLPPTEFLSGYAEMLKHALLSSVEDFQTLAAWDIDAFVGTLQRSVSSPSEGAIAAADAAIRSFAPLIQISLAVKDRIVTADPHEKGLRHALNFGHTIGHAIESLSIEQHTTPQPPHGYCVLWGMIAELYLSVVRLGCPREPLQQLTRLMLNYFDRPACNCKDRQLLLQRMMQDKKNTVALNEDKHKKEVQPNFTLLKRIGEPLINQTVPADIIAEALDYLFSL